jgi:aspartyl-tRNA(Asn)/glutamyl-tRNA(Gln) amidotransferase subunit C
VKISAETVRYLAGLASLELSPDEVRSMQRDLDRVLEYVERLGDLDTEGVPPTAHVLDLPTPYRDDVVKDVLSVEEAIRNAPDHDEHAMLVPKVIE